MTRLVRCHRAKTLAAIDFSNFSGASKSAGNSPALRAIAIGLFAENIDNLVADSRIAAKISHLHSLAEIGAVICAAAVPLMQQQSLSSREIIAELIHIAMQVENEIDSGKDDDENNLPPFSILLGVLGARWLSQTDQSIVAKEISNASQMGSVGNDGSVGISGFIIPT